MDQGICEGIWMHKVLEELKVKIELLQKFYYENKIAINIALNSVRHDKTKHILIDRYFIKEKLDGGLIVGHL